MKLKELYTTIKKHVGRKQADQVELKSSYRIYDSCEICPLAVYIDVVCNDNLKALVISGNPSDDILLLTKSALTIEFSELSNNRESVIITNMLRNMYLCMSQIRGLSLCVKLISGDRFDDAKDYLNTHKINSNKPLNSSEVNDLIKKIEGKIKGKIIQFDQVKKKYDSMNQPNGEKPKVEHYTELLIAISKYTGYHLKKDILTVSEFALYLKDFNRHIESLKNKNHGK